MRVHFSAAMPCALRIGGAAAGMCGEAEKFADLPGGEELLVEFLPADGDYFPLSFIMSADFFARPPQGVEAYLYDCGADVRAARFAPRSPALRVLAQARAAGMLLTAFDWGGPRLCAEGRGFACLDLPSADVDLGEEHIGGEVFARALCRGGRADRLLLLAPDATAAFDGDADAYACGAELRVEARLFDLCGHTLERTFRARGGRLIESGCCPLPSLKRCCMAATRLPCSLPPSPGKRRRCAATSAATRRCVRPRRSFTARTARSTRRGWCTRAPKTPSTCAFSASRARGEG